MRKINHVCYMEGGSIINGVNGYVIENPTILVSGSEDMIFGYGNTENVEKRLERYRGKVKNLTLIELSEYKITREMACYVIRRAVEYTGTGFIAALCRELAKNPDPVSWIKSEMERVSIDLSEKEWR